MQQKILEIKNLQVEIEGIKILKGLNLTINSGELHTIMGPNGAGKSTLLAVLAGNEDYEISGGTIEYFGEDLLDLEIEERAQKGILMAFQNPVEIPGVKNIYFLKAALAAKHAALGLDEMGAADFMRLVKEKSELMKMGKDFLQRSVNEGFSGGEKKRNEILQMLVLEPKLALLDEIDSGLDIDALQLVAKGVNSMRTKDRSQLLITHYQRLLDLIVPDFVHILADGKIVKTGDKNLALEIEKSGYESFGV